MNVVYLADKRPPAVTQPEITPIELWMKAARLMMLACLMNAAAFLIDPGEQDH